MEQTNQMFWADKLANEIATRKKFHYVDRRIPKFRKFVVKTSASISGVLHIGRLSDTIRGESVAKALMENHNAELIWVAEDMDPLRKVPKGVPASYEKYIGMPVTDIPDFHGCHKTYAEHNKDAYFQVLDRFVGMKMKKYSMREQYKKGEFKPFIRKLLANIDQVIEIQNKYRNTPLAKGWSPWTPICEQCGKIITPRVIGFDGKKVHYRCEDYKFETMTANGCGYEGYNDPMKGNGKMMWKSEWASQWAYWKVVSEGAGKEYQVPMSAWWVNGEICERVLDFPMPVPIFYEHILIDGEKMSASKGNVIYPRDWLEAAEAELMKFFFNKKLMKTRSFSWRELPNMYDDYDNHMMVYFGKKEIKNERDAKHMKRLFEFSQVGKPVLKKNIPYSFAALISQICKPEQGVERAVKLLKFTGHFKTVSKKDKEFLQERLILAKNWTEKHAPVDMRIQLNEKVPEEIKEKTSTNERYAVAALTDELKKKQTEEQLQSRIYEIARLNSIEPKDFFRLLYQIIMGKDSGPRLGPFMVVIGKEHVTKLLNEVRI